MNAPCRAESPRWAGDVAAFETLMRAERVRLLAIARRAGLDPDSALDCVQDACHTFLARSDAHDVLARPDEAARLLRTVTFNAARNARRSIQRAAARTDGGATPDAIESPSTDQDSVVALDEARVSLARCLSTLADRQRAVVTLRLLDELPGTDVANVLGIKSEHVAVLLQRAKSALRDCMEAAGHGAETRPCHCATTTHGDCRCTSM
jgi:RNA polymerase sigma-70 factor (ECF subfamily)